MNMLLQYYGVRYLLERKMPWEIESRLWEIAGEKRDVEDIIFIYLSIYHKHIYYYYGYY